MRSFVRSSPAPSARHTARETSFLPALWAASRRGASLRARLALVFVALLLPCLLFELLLRLFEHHGGDPYAARHHRRRLLEAGFAHPVAEATIWAAGVWGTPEETRDFAAWFAAQLSQPTTAELATAQGWADQATLAAIVEELLAWGERPDAYFALMGVAAVGWVEDEA